MAPNLNHGYGKLHCLTHNKTLSREEYHKATDSLKSGLKRKQKPTEQISFFHEDSPTIYLSSRWKVSFIRGRINPTAKKFFANPASDRNKEKKDLWRAREEVGTPPHWAAAGGHERPDALLKAQCKPRNAPEAYDTTCPAGPGLLYDRHHKSAGCLSPGEADNVLILQTEWRRG